MLCCLSVVFVGVCILMVWILWLWFWSRLNDCRVVCVLKCCWLVGWCVIIRYCLYCGDLCCDDGILLL